MKYHGNWDLASLQKFIKEKLGETDELAKKLESNTKVKIAKLDSTQAQGVCQENKVRGLSTFEGIGWSLVGHHQTGLVRR